MLTLAEVLRRHWPDYLARFGKKIPASHRKAVAAILSCRTPARGGQLYSCACGQFHYAYHSCGHRACPQCGHHEASAWIAKQSSRLLPVPYFLVTFTVPEELRRIIRSHQRILYHLLFTESAGALQDVTLSKLGVQPGMLGVLHTWSRQLIYHPHIHYIVPGGGLTPDGLCWKRVRDPDFLLHGKVLGRRFRNRLRRLLEADHQDWLPEIPAKAWQVEWIVDVQPVGSGQSALKYLAAYVYRTALGSQRIVSDDSRGLTFTYRDTADNQNKLATVSPQEFLRRFLQHVPPEGFQRVRHFGWLSPAAKGRWQRIQTLLDWRPAELKAAPPRPAPLCPRCHQPMQRIGWLARAPPRS